MMNMGIYGFFMCEDILVVEREGEGEKGRSYQW